MKGLLNIKIAVDYDELLKDDTILGIQQFTGITNKEQLAVFHLNSLGDKLTEIVNSTPQAVISIIGDLIDDSPQPEEIEIENEPEAEDESTEDDELIEEFESEDEPANGDERKYDVATALTDLKEDVLNIALEKGNPKFIRVCAKLDSYMKDQFETADIETDGETVEKFMGFDYSVEAMEEDYAIDYRDYITGDLETIIKKY